jgi:methyl-accepting chemotaxis protein
MLSGTRRWFYNLSLNGKLILLFSIPFCFLVMVSVLTVLAFRDFEQANDLDKRSYQIRSQAKEYLELLYSMQNGFRGYVLTEDREFLNPYDVSKEDIDLAVLELVRLVEDSPSQDQRDRVAEMQAITRRLIQEKERSIARMSAGHRGEAVAYIKSGRGRELGQAIAALLGQFESEAARIQADRQSMVERKRGMLLSVFIGGALLTFILTGLGVAIVARSVTKPMASLARAAGEIAEEGVAVFPDADRQDEVGILSRSMDEMQRRLHPAERLASLTRVATSIAHDLRTPLVGIERGLQGLQYAADSQLNPDARRLLGDLRTGARLCVGSVQDMLDL